MKKTEEVKEENKKMSFITEKWNKWAGERPAVARWVREGGLFVIVCNLITVFKYLMLQFLPILFARLPEWKDLLL